MSSYFSSGNYIYECKSSPTDNSIGKSINSGSLTKWVGDLRGMLNKYQPSGFRYVFPVNTLDNKCISILEKLKLDFEHIDIKYYDCYNVDNLISQLANVNEAGSFLDYINQVRNK